MSLKPCLANILSTICQIRDRDTLKHRQFKKRFCVFEHLTGKILKINLHSAFFFLISQNISKITNRRQKKFVGPTLILIQIENNLYFEIFCTFCLEQLNEFGSSHFFSQRMPMCHQKKRRIVNDYLVVCLSKKRNYYI